MTRIVVIGAGVNGLAAGVCLLNAGFKDVTIVAKAFSPHTTSDIAGALWRPFGVSDSQAADLNRWGQQTFKYQISRLSEHGYDKTGISLVRACVLNMLRSRDAGQRV